MPLFHVYLQWLNVCCVAYSVLKDSLALVGDFKKDRRRQKALLGAFSGFCVVQGLGVQCAVRRSGYWYSAHCTGVLAPGSMTGVVMFPQSRHSRPTTRTSQCPGPGKYLFTVKNI